jgi:hypoxanthine phosphoribosyltransferase
MIFTTGTEITNGEETKRISKVLFSENDIQTRIQELGKEIANSYDAILCENHELVLVIILNGAFPFGEALKKELVRHLGYGRVLYDFMSISSYHGDIPGDLRLLADLKNSVRGKHVLITEDIVDKGHTLAFIEALLTIKQPASIRSCSLIDKNGAREVDNIEVDFTGFALQEGFVIGFGLDWNNIGRDLPYIVCLE